MSLWDQLQKALSAIEDTEQKPEPKTEPKPKAESKSEAGIKPEAEAKPEENQNLTTLQKELAELRKAMLGSANKTALKESFIDILHQQDYYKENLKK